MKNFIFTALGIILILGAGSAALILITQNRFEESIPQLIFIGLGGFLYYKGRNKPKPFIHDTNTIDDFDIQQLAETDPEAVADTLETAIQMIDDQKKMIEFLKTSNKDLKAKLTLSESNQSRT
ncbi:MAG: hypothetical protein COC24_019260 [Alphaproteobacteria bacterium]|nr:hypothetical protein [Alphaproteobacteria bacterium]